MLSRGICHILVGWVDYVKDLDQRFNLVARLFGGVSFGCGIPNLNIPLCGVVP